MTVVRHCKQAGRDCSETLQTGWKWLQWDIANRLEETAVRHCKQVASDSGEILQTGWKRPRWDIANRLQLTVVRHCKQVGSDCGDFLVIIPNETVSRVEVKSVTLFVVVSQASLRWQTKGVQCWTCSPVAIFTSRVPVGQHALRATGLPVFSGFLLGVPSLQWFSTWSFQFLLVFHLEFPVFSGFPLGDIYVLASFWRHAQWYLNRDFS